MTGKDAAMFPVIASCTLFGIYLVFQVGSSDSHDSTCTFYVLNLMSQCCISFGTF